MSKKRTPSCCLVIDASIAEAAGSQDLPPPTAQRCREFLIAALSVCHQAAWSRAIRAEWDVHQRDFATDWLVTMMKFRKLRHINEALSEELRTAIQGHSDDENVTRKMLKDAHLLEAALATDSRIASLDENARGHFRRLAATLDSIKSIMWVNPTIEDEEAVGWLEDGAKKKRSRQLKP
jgi:hypothetical protein